MSTPEAGDSVTIYSESLEGLSLQTGNLTGTEIGMGDILMDEVRRRLSSL